MLVDLSGSEILSLSRRGPNKHNEQDPNDPLHDRHCFLHDLSRATTPDHMPLKTTRVP